MLSVPSVGAQSSRAPDSDHYFVRDLVLRLQIGQTNADGSPLNRCWPTSRVTLLSEMACIICVSDALDLQLFRTGQCS